MFSKAVFALIALSSLGLAGGASAAPQLPNFDVYAAEARALDVSPELQARRQARREFAAAARFQGYPSEFDAALGVPTFLWVGQGDVPVLLPLSHERLIETWALDHLRRNAQALGLTPKAIEQAGLVEVHDTGRGGLIARFQQRVAGLPVFNHTLNVLMGRSGEALAISGYFAVDARPASDAPAFGLSAGEAEALAVRDLGNAALLGELRTRRVLYAHPGWLEPAWWLEYAGRDRLGSVSAALLVISASDGRTLHRQNLTADAVYRYRVFAAPDGGNSPSDSALGNGYTPFPGRVPDEVIGRTGEASALIALDHGPIVTADPWLPENAAETTGNNVDAYIDSGTGASLPVAPSATGDPDNTYMQGSGDSRAQASSAGAFDYPIAADADPATSDARNAANVSLFYVSNWLHDDWYGHGFTEAAGNAQSSNYGRGGAEGDPLVAQGQDASGRNNASMITFADGRSPIMQMYLFDGDPAGEVRVQVPSGLPAFAWVAAPYGPNTYDITADVALAADGIGDSGTDGCAGHSDSAAAPPQPSLEGKIALLDAGGCSTATKTRFAQSSGALAAVFVDQTDAGPVAPPPATVDSAVIPTVVIRHSDGQRVRDLLAAATTVQMHLARDHARETDRDGALDNTLVAHEYFHHVSSRLVGDASGLSNNQGLALGEGWSDFAALLLTARAEDLGTGAGPEAAYAIGAYATNSFYFGIRRVPYSTNFTRDPLTFRHITDGEPLPQGAPLRDNAQPNSEAHNAGEVWASMLWECYAGLVRAEPYGSARASMQDILIAGLKLTPVSPTFIEARDAILAAALASDPAAFSACARGFARRGAGAGAVAPERNSADHAGIVESQDVPENPGRSAREASGGTSPGLLLGLLLAALARRYMLRQPGIGFGLRSFRPQRSSVGALIAAPNHSLSTQRRVLS